MKATNEISEDELEEAFLDDPEFGLRLLCTGFDARIEFVPEAKRFVIYYRGEGDGRPKGRVNFSIAHELGHFLGLGHVSASEDAFSVMLEKISRGSSKRVLSQGDIDRIKLLYGL